MDQSLALDNWTDLLRETLSGLRRERRRPLRLAILGFGDRLRGDDGAGCCVLEQLEPLRCDHVLLHEVRGPFPEQTAILRAFVPDLVLLVDAGRFGAPPGGVRWLTWEEVVAEDGEGRQDPLLSLLTRYIRATLGCPVVILGIQCRQAVLADTMTPIVARAAVHLGTLLNELLPPYIFV